MRSFFWSYTGKPFKPASDKKIRFTEKYFGVKFPQSYIDLMRISNGGAINFYYFHEPETSVQFSMLEGFWRMSENVFLSEFIDCNIIMFDDWQMPIPQGLVFFAGDLRDGWLAFDYRDNPASDNPPIVYLDIDWIDYTEEGPIHTIAPDFETFVNRLEIGGLDHIWGIAVNYPEDEMIKKLNTCLEITFETKVFPLGGEAILAEHREWKEIAHLPTLANFRLTYNLR